MSTPTATPRATPLPALPFRAFGWSLAGVIGISLSAPPTGFYPLAWIGLVPLLVRWSEHRSAAVCAREVYALVLTLAASTGFWLLFDSSVSRAALGGLGMLLLPLPLVAAVTLAGVVRRRFGLVVGLAALVLTILATEYALLLAPRSVPWLLLGHTQVEALPFIQTADLGGVLLLSFWVLMLNVTAFAALPFAAGKGQWGSWLGDSGIAVALFAVLIAGPAVYGAARTAWSETPVGYARVGLVQPGVAPDEWTASGPARVDVLAELSDRLLGRWTAADSAKATRDGTPLSNLVADGRRRTPRSLSAAPQRGGAGAGTETGAGAVGLLIWPQGSLPNMGTSEREAETLDRLGRWCAERNVALITGATTIAPGDDRDSREDDAEVTSAFLLGPTAAVTRYDQMRHVPVADAPSVPGLRRTLLPVGGVHVGALLGFESLFGDHARRFAQEGADLFVVLPQSDRWGRSGGIEQHLQATRLRAIETRRAVIVASVGGVSALVHPSGQIDAATGWMEQGLIPLDVPTYRSETVYTRHGDWVGQWAAGGALMLYLIAGVVFYLRPDAPKRRVRPQAARV